MKGDEFTTLHVRVDLLIICMAAPMLDALKDSDLPDVHRFSRPAAPMPYNYYAAITMLASSHPESAPASAPGTTALVPRLPRTVVGLHSHLLRHDQVEQHLRLGGIERLQVLVDGQRLTLLAGLPVHEAKQEPGAG